MISLDKIDKALLNIIQQDSTLTIKQLSEKLNLSTTPIHERLKKLERSNIIDKYVALLSPEKIGKKLTSFVQISLKDHAKSEVKKFVDKMIAFNEVMECHYVSGGADFLIKVVVNDMEQFNFFLLEKLSGVPNISRIESLMSLSTVKRTTVYEVI